MKFIEQSGYCTVIDCAFTFRTTIFFCFHRCTAQFVWEGKAAEAKQKKNQEQKQRVVDYIYYDDKCYAKCNLMY